MHDQYSIHTPKHCTVDGGRPLYYMVNYSISLGIFTSSSTLVSINYCPKICCCLLPTDCQERYDWQACKCPRQACKCPRSCQWMYYLLPEPEHKWACHNSEEIPVIDCNWSTSGNHRRISGDKCVWWNQLHFSGQIWPGHNSLWWD